jgi:hypothetical protein
LRKWGAGENNACAPLFRVAYIDQRKANGVIEMWTRERTEDGTFTFTVYDLDNEVFKIGEGFTDYAECDRAAEFWQRMAIFGKSEGPIPQSMDEVFAEMDDDELLSALEA